MGHAVEEAVEVDDGYSQVAPQKPVDDWVGFLGVAQGQ